MDEQITPGDQSPEEPNTPETAAPDDSAGVAAGDAAQPEPTQVPPPAEEATVPLAQQTLPGDTQGAPAAAALSPEDEAAAKQKRERRNTIYIGAGLLAAVVAILGFQAVSGDHRESDRAYRFAERGGSQQRGQFGPGGNQSGGQQWGDQSQSGPQSQGPMQVPGQSGQSPGQMQGPPSSGAS